MREQRNIVAGQYVEPAKADRARELRRDMTPTEAVFWEAVRNRRVAGLKFRRQQVVVGFVADFYCAELGLVVELDGAVHDTTAGADAARGRVIAARGLTVLRFTNDRVAHDLPAVLAEIAAFGTPATGRATSPPGPLSEAERGSPASS